MISEGCIRQGLISVERVILDDQADLRILEYLMCSLKCLLC